MSRGVIYIHTCPVCGEYVSSYDANGYDKAETRKVMGIKKILFIHTRCYEKIRRGSVRRPDDVR